MKYLLNMAGHNTMESPIVEVIAYGAIAVVIAATIAAAVMYVALSYAYDDVHSTNYPGLAGKSLHCVIVAEKRIGATLAGATKLDLSRLKLVSLPACLGKCTKLETFACYFNFQLTELPEELGKCTALKIINISFTSVTKLPELGKCIKLENLNCSHNKLTSLPAGLSNCVALKNLDCARNELTEIPVGEWTSLTRLQCAQNKLIELPAGLGKCTALTELLCYFNKLTSLPAELADCPNLGTLFGPHNPWDEAWLELQKTEADSDAKIEEPTLAGLRKLRREQMQARGVKAARAQ